jgi:hypothetical protein
MDRDFAKTIVQNVRDNLEAHDRDSAQLSFWIAHTPYLLAVVNAMPFELQNDPYEIVDALYMAVRYNDYIPALQDVDLASHVKSLRANRG